MRKRLGDQELEVLRFVSDQGPISVRDVADRFGEQHSLARTTILTVMDRLRKKGFLSRRQVGGIFLYEAVEEQTKVLSDVVGEFVQNTLGGSVSPFVAYLAENKDLSVEEIAELRALVDGLEDGGGR
jgi:predicted transcriptional regulator